MSAVRILLVDDNRQVLDYVREFLSRSDYKVVGTVTDSQVALEAVARLLPDMIVLDISMPVLDGIEVARRVRDTQPRIKIIFLTVDADPDTCRAAMQTGACGYVLKPCLATDLVPAIELAKNGGRFVSPGCE